MASEEKKAVSFETALKRLEDIVQAMESGETDLDTMIASFEEGQKLVKLCTERLNEVEKKIEKLTKSADGSIQPVPFDPEK
jgi:exodeoxyribonuclease VII small subunit